ncbi:hypothetical protein J4729_17155 [Leisingera sp. HS039]|uniref:hypothetical protein n=1 Tax=unclassified Leisingera TaxID=2614906 RepID=UPI001071040D|nr:MULTISPECIES: hypothetical protein [unclassified Leisingera]MBQ4826266.1 hypothetical protein [Leisingera sp. HS039]QBR35672.1 hypothetical protein ETW23_05495 [Leisingera sp. NJS201]
MIRIALAAALLAAPAYASETKEQSCKYQGQVMAAVQQARLDRVKQEEVEQVILDREPEWPEAFSNAIPQLAQHVYAMKRRDLKDADLGALFEEQCLQNWDQIQAMQKQLKSN